MAGPTRQLRVLDDSQSATLMKVAFASSDRKVVDQHFGSACSFVIYGVDVGQAQLLTVSEFAEISPEDTEDKLAGKLALLQGCIAVYCRACGASAVRQLLELGVQPVKVTEGARIEDLIESLQQELREGPSSWLAKAIQRGRTMAADKFDAMDAEGWLE
ncbi:MAG: NifB/NifX family molybdenum-iron cluster-binding protein [Pseudomonadota bacterium]|nr:NifB/NifX family molybdenum-iron cluster-binding protein [Pseudomonadota bacterium]